jgi:hypothetical protein
MSEDEILDVVEESPPEDEADFLRLTAELEARCNAASMKLDKCEEPPGENYVKLHFPAGRDTQPVRLYSTDNIRAFLAIPFEKYVFLGDYVATCSYSDRLIEARFSSSPNSLPSLIARITGNRVEPGAMRTDRDIPPLEIRNPTGPEKLVLGPSTPAFKFLGNTSQFWLERPSLRIEEVSVTRHDQAVEILERVANSFFFQLDLLRGVAATLLRRRQALQSPFARNARREFKELEFPKSEYDRDPISIYWYARRAIGMPLLQFLAYYQTIEYYFPTYSKAEARRKIRNILKSPAFRADRDNDVGKILLAAHSSNSGFGDERSQLRATLNECLEAGALREFFTESDERTKFFSTKTDGLTDQKIQIRTDGADLRNDVADRIYDIRCKIVHTKSGGREGEVELLLPFSKEAELLYADIELIQFIAREVLVSASSPLRLINESASS